MKSHVTIGVAGHIDHGKTTLTKALTDIETDRLIEEKKRKISIENGFAYLDLEDGSRAAVIDVPGHERFIRQMIAGVAGIDLVLLVIAADEGVMPQTKEHLDILKLLSIPSAMVVITKTGLVDEELLLLVEDDIHQVLEGTAYEKAPFFYVDSLTGEGVESLKSAIITFAKQVNGRSGDGPLRLPIDDVFTIHGHGTVVRGTIFNGSISLDSDVQLLPQGLSVRIKQLQVHHDVVQQAVAGQRVAVNLGGVDYTDVKRGDVLITSELYQPTERLDVILQGLEGMDKPLKQRGTITVHLATSSVRGRLILFDRNRWEKGETIYAQLELEKSIVAKKGDRFVIRRPSPAETLGGGEVLNPRAGKHRFGEKTVHELELLAKGTPEEWIEKALSIHLVMNQSELKQETELNAETLNEVLTKLLNAKTIKEIKPKIYVLSSKIEQVANTMLEELKTYHESFPLRQGMNRAEWMKGEVNTKALKEAALSQLENDNKVVILNHLVSQAGFQPHYPTKWKQRLLSVENKLKDQGIQPENWSSILEGSQLPDDLVADFRRHLFDSKVAYSLDDDRLIHTVPFAQATKNLQAQTKSQFTVQEAKDILGLSRKHLIPFLELCDQLGLTKRQENSRIWCTKEKKA